MDLFKQIFFWSFKNELTSLHQVGFGSNVFMNTPSDCHFRRKQLFCYWPQFSLIVCLTLWINLGGLIELECMEFFLCFDTDVMLSFYFCNSLRILRTKNLATLRKHAISKSLWSAFNATITAYLFILFFSIGSIIINFW